MTNIKFTALDVVLLLLFLLSVYFILTRIFGHSATDLTITVSLFTFLGTLLFRVMHILLGLNREFGEFKVKTIQSFGNMKQDMQVIKGHLLKK